MDDQFRKAEEQYFILRGKLETGRIARAEFESALKDLMAQDARGRYWVLGAESGKWHVHENGQWLEGDPSTGALIASTAPPAPPTTLPEQRGAPSPPPVPRGEPARPISPPPPLPVSSAPAPVKKNGGCLIGCLLMAFLVIAIAVAGFFAAQSGILTQAKVLNLVGLGPAHIEIDNFRDDAIQVNIVRAEPVGSGTPTPTPFNLRLNAFDVKTHPAPNPGKYRVEFRATRGNTDLGSCTLTVRGGDQWQFVVLPERIAVNRVNNPSTVGRDFVIQTSALCR